MWKVFRPHPVFMKFTFGSSQYNVKLEDSIVLMFQEGDKIIQSLNFYLASMLISSLLIHGAINKFPDFFVQAF